MSQAGVLVLTDRELSDYTALPLTFLRAFENIGCPTDYVFYNINLRMYKLVYDYFPWYDHAYLASAQSAILTQVEQSNCECVLVVKGVFLLPQTIDKIKSLNKQVYCFNPDDPFEKEFGTSNRNIRACIQHYDGYFIWSKRLIKQIENAGCANVTYVPFAVDDEIIKAASPDRLKQERAYDLSFIGNPDEKRSRLIHNLAGRLEGKEIRTAIYGAGWKPINGFENRSYLQGNEYLEAMYDTKINLNILRDQNEGSHNMRTFEIPATGGFLLHEESDEAKSFFEPGVEAEYYHSPEECYDKILYYIKNEKERIRIAEAGYERTIKSNYSYKNIAQLMLDRMRAGISTITIAAIMGGQLLEANSLFELFT